MKILRCFLYALATVSVFATSSAIGQEAAPAEVEKAGEEAGTAEGDPKPAERPKDGKIYGRWKVVTMEGFPDDGEKPTFQFNKDGTVMGSFGERVKHGRFKLSADRSTLTMMDKGQAIEDGETAEVIELSDTLLELRADGALLRMERDEE